MLLAGNQQLFRIESDLRAVSKKWPIVKSKGSKGHRGRAPKGGGVNPQIVRRRKPAFPPIQKFFPREQSYEVGLIVGAEMEKPGDRVGGGSAAVLLQRVSVKIIIGNMYS